MKLTAPPDKISRGYKEPCETPTILDFVELLFTNSSITDALTEE